MTTESKLGVCRYCGNPYHRGWQCPKRPKKTSSKSAIKKKSRNIIIKQFDEVYSRYLRMLQVNQTGHCKCFICGKKLSFDDACIGHYISRRYISTRFEPMNANVICYKCNMIDKNQPEILEYYKQRIIQEYGQQGYNSIIQKKLQKISTPELESQYEDYKNKLRHLQKIV